jgi:hypothetical protein
MLATVGLLVYKQQGDALGAAQNVQVISRWPRRYSGVTLAIRVRAREHAAAVELDAVHLIMHSKCSS